MGRMSLPATWDSETAGEIIDLMVQLNRTNGQTFVLVTTPRTWGTGPTVLCVCGTGRSWTKDMALSASQGPGEGADSPQAVGE